jgi:hypothetical protein
MSYGPNIADAYRRAGGFGGLEVNHQLDFHGLLHGPGDRIKLVCPLLAQSGHGNRTAECPLSGVKQT